MLNRLARSSVRSVVAVISAAAFLSACHSWSTRDRASPADLRRDAPREMRITRSSGDVLRLEDAVVREDSVVGRAPGGEREAVPISDVSRLEVREFDTVDTVLLGAGIAAGAVVAYGAAFTIAFLDTLEDIGDDSQQ